MPIEHVNIDVPTIETDISGIQPLNILVADGTDWDPVWNRLMRTYHYLGYRKMLGTRIKYIVLWQERPIAALGFRAASLHLQVRDEFIGWSNDQKSEFLAQVVNNNRFLIVPSVRVPNLGSYLLSRIISRLRVDWESKYGAAPLLLETFVDPRYFSGTVYRAANWWYLGHTKGYTRLGKKYHYHGHRKEVYVYPIEPEFRQIIGCVPPPLRQCAKEACTMMIQEQKWDKNVLQDAGVTEDTLEELVNELTKRLNQCTPFLNRESQHMLLTAYWLGLLSDLPRKSLEPIALRYLSEDQVRSMQRFASESSWDDQGMLQTYWDELASLIEADDGVLSIDSSEFAKKGNESVGTVRQYSGRLGKVDNCQSGIFVGYASSKGYGLVHRQLYMPRPWFSEEYAGRREACRVPEELEFQTKTQIARALLKELYEQDRFRARWLTCDSAFGEDRAFLETIGQNYWYVADLRSSALVWLERPNVAPREYSGQGRPPSKLHPDTPPMTVAELAKHTELDWKKTVLDNGAKGPIIAHVARVRVVLCHKRLPKEEVWLLLRRHADGSLKYSISNCPIDTQMEEMIRVSLLRWPIEQCFEECKSDLGMGHYETRGWLAWHRHMLFVFIVHFILLSVRLHTKKKQVDRS